MFPNTVNTQPAPAVAGDFADSNPRATVDAGPGAFVAGLAGVAVGLFAWADAAQATVSNTGAGAPTGFVARSQQALITTYLQEASNVIPKGMGVTLHSAGSFWVRNAGSAASAVGQKAYALNATGAVTFGATVAWIACQSWGDIGPNRKLSRVRFHMLPFTKRSKSSGIAPDCAAVAVAVKVADPKTDPILGYCLPFEASPRPLAA